MRLYSYLLLIVSSVVSIYIISKANCQNKSTQEVSLYMMSEIESLTYKELKKIKSELWEIEKVTVKKGKKTNLTKEVDYLKKITIRKGKILCSNKVIGEIKNRNNVVWLQLDKSFIPSIDTNLSGNYGIDIDLTLNPNCLSFHKEILDNNTKVLVELNFKITSTEGCWFASDYDMN